MTSLRLPPYMQLRQRASAFKPIGQCRRYWDYWPQGTQFRGHPTIHSGPEGYRSCSWLLIHWSNARTQEDIRKLTRIQAVVIGERVSLLVNFSALQFSAFSVCPVTHTSLIWKELVANASNLLRAPIITFGRTLLKAPLDIKK